MSALSITLTDPQSAHVAMQGTVWPHIKAMTSAGHKLTLTIKRAEDQRSLHQNAWYWGILLKEISEQARIGGQRYTVDAWHQLGKRQHLARKVTKSTVAGRKRKVVTVSIGSTAKLSVRQMNDYLERFSAFAVTDLGVVFSVGRWQEYCGEYIDQSTGEIMRDE